jgi:hypothetical protein
MSRSPRTVAGHLGLAAFSVPILLLAPPNTDHADASWLSRLVPLERSLGGSPARDVSATRIVAPSGEFVAPALLVPALQQVEWRIPEGKLCVLAVRILNPPGSGGIDVTPVAVDSLILPEPPPDAPPGVYGDDAELTVRRLGPRHFALELDVASMARTGDVTLRVFDVQGRLVATAWHGPVRHRIDAAWSGRTDAGRLVAAGMYYVRATVGDLRLRGRLAVGGP